MTIQGLCVTTMVAAAVATVFGVPYLAFRFAGNTWGWVAVATDIGLFCVMHMKYPTPTHTRSHSQRQQPSEIPLSNLHRQPDWIRPSHWPDTSDTPLPDYWQATHDAALSNNPATGLPMINEAFDIGGNWYGCDNSNMGLSSVNFESSSGCDIDSFGVDMNDNW